MRNKIAKKIKKEVYGDNSPRQREHGLTNKKKYYNVGTIINAGKRAEYRALKRIYKALTKKQKEEI